MKQLCLFLLFLSFSALSSVSKSDSKSRILIQNFLGKAHSSKVISQKFSVAVGGHLIFGPRSGLKGLDGLRGEYSLSSEGALYIRFYGPVQYEMLIQDNEIHQLSKLSGKPHYSYFLDGADTTFYAISKAMQALRKSGSSARSEFNKAFVTKRISTNTVEIKPAKDERRWVESIVVKFVKGVPQKLRVNYSFSVFTELSFSDVSKPGKIPHLLPIPANAKITRMN